MAYIGKQPLVGNYTVLDPLTATTTDTYALTKGAVAVYPHSPANCIVSLNGVIQAPFDSYSISGSNIVFSSALTASDSIDFITVLGDVLNVGTVSDGTIGLNKLSATGTKDATTFLRGDNTFQAVSSDYVKLATSIITANTTAVTFDGYFSSDYDTYIVFGNNIYTDGNAGLELYLRQSSTNLTASQYRYCGIDVNSSNSSQVHYGHPNDKINMNRVTTNISANVTNSFQILLFDPNNNQGSHYAEYYSNIFYQRNDGYLANTYLSGNYNAVSNAITGFQIKPSTGNFDQGIIVLYGVKK